MNDDDELPDNKSGMKRRLDLSCDERGISRVSGYRERAPIIAKKKSKLSSSSFKDHPNHLTYSLDSKGRFRNWSNPQKMTTNPIPNF